MGRKWSNLMENGGTQMSKFYWKNEQEKANFDKKLNTNEQIWLNGSVLLLSFSSSLFTSPINSPSDGWLLNLE